MGALTRHADLLGRPSRRAAVPDGPDAERVIADPVVRNRGTIGGSLGAGRPGRGPHHRLRRPPRPGRSSAGRGGERTVDIHEFHRGPYETACEQHELLTEIRFPIGAGQGSAYEKVERRVGDWAVGAAGRRPLVAEDGTIADATIGLTALGAGGPGDRGGGRAAGQRPSEDLFAEAGRLAPAASPPIEDQRGPVEYKRHLADELTRRVRRSPRRARPTAVQGG